MQPPLFFGNCYGIGLRNCGVSIIGDLDGYDIFTGSPSQRGVVVHNSITELAFNNAVLILSHGGQFVGVVGGAYCVIQDIRIKLRGELKRTYLELGQVRG